MRIVSEYLPIPLLGLLRGGPARDSFQCGLYRRCLQYVFVVGKEREQDEARRFQRFGGLSPYNPLRRRAFEQLDHIVIALRVVAPLHIAAAHWWHGAIDQTAVVRSRSGLC